MREIKRIQKTSVMNRMIVDDDGTKRKFDFPSFMKYTREVKYTKDGKERNRSDIDSDKKKLNQRIDPSLLCPMNWLEECLDGIKDIREVPESTESFFVKIEGNPNRNQITRITRIVEEYDKNVSKLKTLYATSDPETYQTLLIEQLDKTTAQISKMKIGSIATINRLVEIALGISNEVGRSKCRQSNPSKYTRLILKLLHKTNKDKFLKCFTEG